MVSCFLFCSSLNPRPGLDLKAGAPAHPGSFHTTPCPRKKEATLIYFNFQHNFAICSRGCRTNSLPGIHTAAG